MKGRPRRGLPKTGVATEEQEQITFAAWLAKKNIKFTASANGGSRHMLEAVKFKRMGVSPGFPDIFIPTPCNGYHGLFLELKRKKGGIVSNEQIKWLKYLREQGYYADVAYGADEAITIVTQYMTSENLLLHKF